MKILLTGATGFLGKHVLSRLLESDRVEHIVVFSRGPRTHPDPRVQIVQGDLALPQSWRGLLATDFSHIIHLAGLYDFEAPLSANYKSNVIGTLNLIDFARSCKTTPMIHFASTYAVGYGLNGELAEEPLKELPDSSQAYAYTKAVAEKAVTDSGLPYRVFRLGVLIGDQAEGTIEKIDGPYYVYRLAYQLGKNRLFSKLPYLPLPFDEAGQLPVVPVDAAATVIARSVVESATLPEKSIYNVVNPNSANLKELAQDCFSRFMPNTKISLNPEFGNQKLLGLQEVLTGIPAVALEYATHPVKMQCQRFEADFGMSIPAYESYRNVIFSGFLNYMEGLQ